LVYDGAMRGLPLLTLALLGSCAAPQPEPARQQPMEVAGRAAGPAQRCVAISPTNSIRISQNEPHMLIYGSGKTIWANDLDPGCAFRLNDILVTEPSGASYCRGDIVRSVDQVTHMPGPSCIMGDFVPYTRP
jgi:hypothetical protein